MKADDKYKAESEDGEEVIAPFTNFEFTSSKLDILADLVNEISEILIQNGITLKVQASKLDDTDIYMSLQSRVENEEEELETNADETDQEEENENVPEGEELDDDSDEDDEDMLDGFPPMPTPPKISKQPSTKSVILRKR